MVKDSNTLKRLRWRYDKLLHPSDFVDNKMRDILMIPPARKPKEDLKIREVLHNVNTRLKAEQDEAERLIKVAESKGQKKVDSKNKERMDQREMVTAYRRETAQIELMNQATLREFKGTAYVFVKLADGERQLTMDIHEINLLSPAAQISDTIVYICLK